jgi:hypothetical protein
MESALKPSPTLLFRQTALLGAVFLWLWIIYTIFLGPIYGWHLHGLGDLIQERADFLSSKGGQPHQILNWYHDISFLDVWASGSLLSFMFFAWPWACIMAVQETLALQFRDWKRWGLRALGLSLAWLTLSHEFVPFFGDTWMWIYGLSIVLGAPCVVGGGIEFVIDCSRTGSELTEGKMGHSPWQNGSLKKWILGLNFFLWSLAILSHPVWHQWVQPQAYEKLNKIPVIRDMLLLNEDGHDWINTWYYGSSPYLMERERVTRFQPMMVGLMAMNETWWKPALVHGFRGDSHGSSQKIHFFNLEMDDDIDTLIRHGKVDYVAIASDVVDRVDTSEWPKTSFGVFHMQEVENGPNVITPKTYYIRSGPYTESPITLRSYEIQRKVGHQPWLMKAFISSKMRLKDVLADSNTIFALSFLIILGLGAVIWILIGMVQRSSLLLLLILGMAFIYPNWRERADFWHHELWEDCSGGDSQWSQILLWHGWALDAQKHNVIVVIDHGFSKDARIKMLQISVLGRGYSLLKAEEKVKANERIFEALNAYDKSPLNMRYKIYDAFGSIEEVKQKLSQCYAGEDHPYVLWYAARAF